MAPFLVLLLYFIDLTVCSYVSIYLSSEKYLVFSRSALPPCSFFFSVFPFFCINLRVTQFPPPQSWYFCWDCMKSYSNLRRIVIFVAVVFLSLLSHLSPDFLPPSCCQAHTLLNFNFFFNSKETKIVGAQVCRSLKPIREFPSFSEPLHLRVRYLNLYSSPLGPGYFSIPEHPQALGWFSSPIRQVGSRGSCSGPAVKPCSCAECLSCKQECQNLSLASVRMGSRSSVVRLVILSYASFGTPVDRLFPTFFQ